MAEKQPDQIDLTRYTLWSLQFTGTTVTSWRGERLLRVVNRVYVELIRSGWPVPLSFILDVATLLLYSLAAPREFPILADTRCPQPMRDLSNRYRAVLARLKRDTVFSEMVDLLRDISEPEEQDHAVATLIPFLVKAAGGFQNIYSFKSREMTVRVMKIARKGAGMAWTDSEGNPKKARHLFRDHLKAASQPETQAIIDVLNLLCDHFEQTRVENILTPERQLVIEIAARTPRGASRVDYRFLSWLLGRPTLDDAPHETPWPQFVHEVLPTNLLEVEGNAGGYIDVSRKTFRGSVSEILPSELGLWESRQYMLQKLLNEGVLTYVRENYEYIERELRVMLCFVVDNSPRMIQDAGSGGDGLLRGLTPWMRARALALVLLQDLARWMPRTDVSVDCGIYLWSQEPASAKRTGRQQMAQTCQAQLDLFGWTRDAASRQLTFLSGVTEQFPEVFYGHVSAADAAARPELEASPYDFMKHRQSTRHYHCRHLIYLSSSSTLNPLLAEAPADLGFNANDSGPDSIHLVTCDTDKNSLGVARLDSLEDAWQFMPAFSAMGDTQVRLPGQISEERLRHQIVSSIILKGAGKPMLASVGDGLEDDFIT